MLDGSLGSGRAKAKLEESREDLARLQELRAEDDPANLDEISRLEERVAESLRGVDLNPNEIPALEELLLAANDVTDETKVERILTVVDESFADRSVLFFTEYKATQALLMSALHKRYGDGCVTFINGDGFIEDVQDSSRQHLGPDGRPTPCGNAVQPGEVRFLVSTEAAGEGVDLQEHCSALIHADLPWNPMRLHQRVGRLSRYGQTDPVDVVTVRNPDTVESRIWCRFLKRSSLFGVGGPTRRRTFACAFARKSGRTISRSPWSIATTFSSPGNRNRRTGRMSRGSGCGSSTERFGMQWSYRGFRHHPGPGRADLRIQCTGPHHRLGWPDSRRRRGRPVGW